MKDWQIMLIPTFAPIYLSAWISLKFTSRKASSVVFSWLYLHNQSTKPQNLNCTMQLHLWLFFTLLPFVATLLLQTSVRSSSPYAPWSSGSGRTSRRSSWNSLGRAPSYKRQKRQSGERRSLLSGEGGSSSEDGEGGGEGGGGLMEEDDASLARTDSMSQSQRGPRHRRMESVETRSSMDLPPDALLQVDPSNSYQFKPRTNC